MKLFLGTMAAAAALAAPAFADGHVDPMTMTCADFSAMDEAGMTAAYDSVSAAMMAGGDTSATAEGATDDAMATDDAAADTAGAEATTDTTAEASTDTTAEASTDTATAEGDMASGDPMMTALADACTADPSLTVMDAMTQAQGAMGTESTGG